MTRATAYSKIITEQTRLQCNLIIGVPVRVIMTIANIHCYQLCSVQGPISVIIYPIIKYPVSFNYNTYWLSCP